METRHIAKSLLKFFTSNNFHAFYINKRFLFALRAIQGKVFHFCIFSDFIVRLSTAYRTEYPIHSYLHNR